MESISVRSISDVHLIPPPSPVSQGVLEKPSLGTGGSKPAVKAQQHLAKATELGKTALPPWMPHFHYPESLFTQTSMEAAVSLLINSINTGFGVRVVCISE